MGSKSKQKVESPNQSAISLSGNKDDENYWCTPDFIYGGPFIKVQKPEPFFDSVTPFNQQLEGTYKKSYAYYSLKERLPVILTKIIDYLSREGSKKASPDDVQFFIKFINKLKSDLITNKKYDPFTFESPETDKWNTWLENLSNTHYFTNTWVFTECYVYRKLREACELRPSLNNFDPFEEQKAIALKDSIELMCLVADQLVTMLPPSEKDKRKADFMTLLKICLWANKCDLSLSAGEQVSLKSKEKLPEAVSVTDNAKSKTVISQVSVPELIDPFQMIIDLKDKVLIDDSGKAADQVVTRAENIAKAIEGESAAEAVEGGEPKGGKKSPAPAAPPAEGEAEPEAPQIPCPAKMTIPQVLMYDIVCDNAGYELFADICFAHFLISQEIVQKVRFHVKKMPWFVSDATPTDFKQLLETCIKANYKREVPPEPKPEPAEGEEPPEPEPPRIITSDNLKQIAQQWQQLYEKGVFDVMCEDFWTYPHVYKDMKKIDYNMYRKLQYAVGILFKGDLNYRKLLGERNCNPYSGFEAALQGFIPAPIIAVRTVKAELICGLPKGKWHLLNKLDDKWMQTGDYGVIQFCSKGEALKASDRPCIDYGDKCFSLVCPVHTDM